MVSQAEYAAETEKHEAIGHLIGVVDMLLIQEECGVPLNLSRLRVYRDAYDRACKRLLEERLISMKAGEAA